MQRVSDSNAGSATQRIDRCRSQPPEFQPLPDHRNAAGTASVASGTRGAAAAHQRIADRRRSGRSETSARLARGVRLRLSARLFRHGDAAGRHGPAGVPRQPSESRHCERVGDGRSGRSATRKTASADCESRALEAGHDLERISATTRRLRSRRSSRRRTSASKRRRRRGDPAAARSARFSKRAAFGSTCCWPGSTCSTTR